MLIPNERGLDAALEQRERFDEINVFLSASETHNRKNVNRSIAESLAGLEGVLGRAREAGLRCEGVISTSFGCPYEGHVPPERVLEIAARLRDAGAQEIGFGDTTGMANPRQVREFFARRAPRWGRGGADGALPQHARAGPGERAGGAGGRASRASSRASASWAAARCRPGATGNIATEDLVSMLHEMGIETGIDLPALLACARRVQEILGRPLGSHTLVAGPVDWRGAGALTGRRLAATARPGGSLARGWRFSRIAATQYSCTATSISSVCASAGRAEASITRLARPTATASWRAARRRAPAWPARAARARRRG